VLRFIDPDGRLRILALSPWLLEIKPSDTSHQLAL
jgi:hypothetical protein